MDNYEKCLKELKKMRVGPNRLATTNDMWFCTVVIVVSILVTFGVAVNL